MGYHAYRQKFNFQLLEKMKNSLILISFFIMLLCCSCTKNNDETSLAKTQNHQITAIEFRQNPAMDYYFTRKYRLNKTKLFYYDQFSRLIEMENNNYILARKIIDSLPKEVFKYKFVGHTTVDVDIPDWTIEIITENNDTIFLASGGLPNYLKKYDNMVWNTINKLDSKN